MLAAWGREQSIALSQQRERNLRAQNPLDGGEEGGVGGGGKEDAFESPEACIEKALTLLDGFSKARLD